jgi:CDP-diacylglycerol--glycerol-3-phosphate 3-phosphatidyltransferase
MSVAAQDDLRRTLFNVPNQLTMLRLILAVAVFALIANEFYRTAMVVFLIAASTDWIDGYWARKYGQVTKIGRIFDPFVDKIIICGTFIMLAAEPDSLIAGWMAVVVVAREMLVTALRSFIEQSGGDFSASKAGKLKMVFQCAAVVASLAALISLRFQKVKEGAELPPWLYWSVVAAVWSAVVLTIYSGISYVAAALKFLREAD